MIDLHVHTHHSCDSSVTMKEYCDRAVNIGITHICFTDHVDHNKTDEGYGFYNSQKYFDELSRCRDIYNTNLAILSGIEFSEPHVYKKELEQYCKLPYDFVLGSIHFWMNDLFPSEMVSRSIPLETVFEKYWEQVYAAVCFGGFDSLAHIDFPKRFYKDSVWKKEQMIDIFSAMNKNNISLEINTSSLRKGLNETLPGIQLLDLYKLSGGKNITFGSDSHSVEDLAFGYDIVKCFLSDDLTCNLYRNRKAEKHATTNSQ